MGKYSILNFIFALYIVMSMYHVYVWAVSVDTKKPFSN
jgi:hypothetical protein